VLEKRREREKSTQRELNNTLTYEVLMVRFEKSPVTSVQSCIMNVALGEKPLVDAVLCGCEAQPQIASHKIGKGNPLFGKAESWERHWPP